MPNLVRVSSAGGRPGEPVNFAYTGDVQSYTIPKKGTYQLEVWGAQGGNTYTGDRTRVTAGGYGGYSKGNVKLNKNDVIYICVGGCVVYNGGGYGAGGESGWGNAYGASGGGATHIATTNRGVLSNYNSYRSEVLIVAGGGGGANQQEYNGEFSPGKPGNSTQYISGNFGEGRNATHSWEAGAGGGGGGWYGGKQGNDDGIGATDRGGGGGSGYVGGCISGTTSMSVGVRASHGYATITYIGR